MARVESNLVAGLSGSIGNLVYVQTENGTYVRERVIPHDPHTPAQSACRRSLTAAKQVYQSLNTAQLLAWQAYAASLPPTVNAAGKVRTLRACDAFCKLALKFYQVNPHGTPPLLPPASAFSGENVSLTATAGTGQIVFTADAPNSAPVVTELLLQPLPSVLRKPLPKKYRSQGFHPFTGGGLALAVPVTPGIYVPAYRFVQAATGQETPLVPLPLLEVTE